MARTLIPMVAMIALTACQAGLPSRALTDDPLAAPGFADDGGVDPMIVGDRLLDGGEPELALASYIKAASEQGLTPPLLRGMAAANLRLGRLGQSERLLRQYLEEEPRDAGAWNDLGVILLERGQTGEAHETFRRAFALDASIPEIKENLTRSLSMMEAMRYPEEEESAFTLTRRPDGVFGLHSPE
ncbi:tetratricopeptide repeat protein [Jannaschia aquimarina]|uniref:Tetratricopeptide repeat protein n=1 Tax=Jannaschia aquimarina TaxID=935700 RepID=A0A0D1EFR7_9RHOB|nr:tetratricopeptide repeat protein [Jannaschia aquimarina]KIT16529.1 Tetratricopeptide repeat protein [Jannaschia aquimarina]SNT06412.1 Tetratricopeptide repeat-containing protein [Jannaschia aquimarina]